MTNRDEDSEREIRRQMREDAADDYTGPRRLPPRGDRDTVAEWEDYPWRGNETEAAEMNRGQSFVRKVLEATSEPAQGGLITKWTYRLEDGHTVTRFLINNAKPHQRAACDICKATAPQSEEERREERERMAAKGFGRERDE